MFESHRIARALAAVTAGVLGVGIGAAQVETAEARSSNSIVGSAWKTAKKKTKHTASNARSRWLFGDLVGEALERRGYRPMQKSTWVSKYRNGNTFAGENEHAYVKTGDRIYVYQLRTAGWMGGVWKVEAALVSRQKLRGDTPRFKTMRDAYNREVPDYSSPDLEGIPPYRQRWISVTKTWPAGVDGVVYVGSRKQLATLVPANRPTAVR